jgi:DNA topoisomerase-1
MFQMLSYNRANRAVALLCNHQRAVPKTHDTSMANLQIKIEKKTEEVEKAEKEYKAAKKEKGADAEKKKATLKRVLEQLDRLETQKTDKDENKQIALGTSKLNYLDPRISVAWCKKYNVPLEKVYNKTQKDKFRWAIEMTDEDYEF